MGGKSLCADGSGIFAQVMQVDPDFPCDVRATSERELCEQPVAVLQAPLEISSCPGSPLQLDGSRSSGSGIKPFIFRWYAHPVLSDNFLTLKASLDAKGSVDSLVLQPELDGGRTSSSPLL